MTFPCVFRLLSWGFWAQKPKNTIKSHPKLMSFRRLFRLNFEDDFRTRIFEENFVKLFTVWCNSNVPRTSACTALALTATALHCSGHLSFSENFDRPHLTEFFWHCFCIIRMKTRSAPGLWSLMTKSDVYFWWWFSTKGRQKVWKSGGAIIS